MSRCTRSKAQLDAKVGGTFALYEGQITGKFLELVG